jgi:hypothetical protein
MALGIALYRADGRKFFSTESTTWNYVGSFIAPKLTTKSMSFPDITQYTTIIIQTNLVGSPPSNQEGNIHNISKNGTTVTATYVASPRAGFVDTQVIVLGR